MKPRKDFTSILLALVLAALALATTACGASAGMTDSKAAKAIRDYFAPAGAHPLDGLKVTKLAVTEDNGERTLHLELASDETDKARQSVEWLVIGGTSDEGWVGDLNRMGLGLALVDLRVTYASGLADLSSHIDVARHSASWFGGGENDIGPRPVTTFAPLFFAPHSRRLLG
jgi:ABC-type glycerol-3-phosphate transport system substrate-binding protein